MVGVRSTHTWVVWIASSLLAVLHSVQTASFYSSTLQCYQCENVKLTGESSSSLFSQFHLQSDVQCGTQTPSSSSLSSCPNNAAYSCAYIEADISGSVPLIGSFSATVQQRLCLPGTSSGCQSVDKSQLNVLNGALSTLFSVKVKGEICTCTTSGCIPKCSGVTILNVCLQIWILGVACGGAALLFILLIVCCCCCCRSKRATPVPAYNTAPMQVVQLQESWNNQPSNLAPGSNQPPPGSTWNAPQTGNLAPGNYSQPPPSTWNTPYNNPAQGNYGYDQPGGWNPPAYHMATAYQQPATQTADLPPYRPKAATNLQPPPGGLEKSETNTVDDPTKAAPETWNGSTSRNNFAAENPMYQPN